MFELTINGVVYQFSFNMGFMREINKTVTTTLDGTNTKKNIGLQYAVAGVIDGDMESLVQILCAANKDGNPRVTQQLLDAYIDDENTNIDELFDTVLNFLKRTNATKQTTIKLLEAVENQKQQN